MKQNSIGWSSVVCGQFLETYFTLFIIVTSGYKHQRTNKWFRLAPTVQVNTDYFAVAQLSECKYAFSFSEISKQALNNKKRHERIELSFIHSLFCPSCESNLCFLTPIFEKNLSLCFSFAFSLPAVGYELKSVRPKVQVSRWRSSQVYLTSFMAEVTKSFKLWSNIILSGTGLVK